MTSESRSAKAMKLPPGPLGDLLWGNQPSCKKSKYAEANILEKQNVGALLNTPVVLPA